MSCRLWKETLAVAEDYLCQCCNNNKPPPTNPLKPTPTLSPPSESAAGMMIVMATELEKQNHARFNSLAQNFLRHCGTDTCASLRKVMEELVGDGHLNWGRVVSLFTFTGVLARLMNEQEGGKVNGMGGGAGGNIGKLGQQGNGNGTQKEQLRAPGHCRGLAETIADYLGEEKKDWMMENDGWEGFCKFSRSAQDVNQDSSMKTALFAAAGVGLAGLTFLLVR